MNDLPKVTLILPCRNEEQWIGRCLDSIQNNIYPSDLIEIIVIDGLSSDKTISIINHYKTKDNRIKLFENKKKIFPSAVNIGINNSTGEYLLIMGAHAYYDPNYISSCIKHSLEYDSDNVGGILITIPQDTNFIGNLISNSLTNSFGVGNATFRTGSDKPVYVDTVFGGCYKRDIFKKIGSFNENLISSSDMEFNRRLSFNGGKILLVPEIRANYYTRSTFTKFVRNNIRNGFWAIFPINYVAHIPVSLRHFIPLVFLSGIIGLSLLSLISEFFMTLLISLLGLYFVLSLVFSIKKIKEKRYNIFLPIFLFILHITYGIGSLWAVARLIFSKNFYKTHIK